MSNVFATAEKKPAKERMLVIAAHVGDFVWRSGGVIARYVQEGHAVKVLVLSYGLRGEAQDYWKRPGANTEEGLKIRRAEGEEAAKILGVTDIEFLEWSDYPMVIDRERNETIAHKIREFRPTFIITHDRYDAFNADHNTVSAAVVSACATASGSGFIDGLPCVQRRTPIFGYEPHATEECRFFPNLYVDITSSFETKVKAMNVYQLQQFMIASYITKAQIRAAEANTLANRSDYKYAEAFVIYNPIANEGRFVY